jgi:hypothetical protein
MANKEALHQLVDALPESEWEHAERLLTALTTTDPVLRALLLAPEDDEPETDDERAAVAEARADLAAGRVVLHDEARRRLLGDP